MVVLDSSSIILLAKIGLLDEFLDAVKTCPKITEKVFEEATMKEDIFDAKLIKKRVEERKISVEKIKNKGAYYTLQKEFNMGGGETESLGLCIEQNEVFVTDEKKAMYASKILSVPFTTVPNIIRKMYDKKIIKETKMEHYIQKLEKYGRYTADIITALKEKRKNETNE